MGYYRSGQKEKEEVNVSDIALGHDQLLERRSEETKETWDT